MDENPTMAKVYQEVYSDVKDNAESEANYLKDLHHKFDYYYDKEKMSNKYGTEWYDPEEIDNYDEMDFSTEWTSETDDIMYKRYKMAKHEAKEGIHKYEALTDKLQQDGETWRNFIEDPEMKNDEDGNFLSNDPQTVIQKLQEKKQKAKELDVLLEQSMAKMRYEKAQRNKSNRWVFSGNDQMYGEYIPDMSKSEEAKK